MKKNIKIIDGCIYVVTWNGKKSKHIIRRNTNIHEKDYSGILLVNESGKKVSVFNINYNYCLINSIHKPASFYQTLILIINELFDGYIYSKRNHSMINLNRVFKK